MCFFLKYNKMRTITLYNLKSLIFFNKVKLTPEEKELAESEPKLNRDLIRFSCYAIEKRPRHLQYSFVTDLFNNNSLDKSFMTLTSKCNYDAVERTLTNEQEASTSSFSSEMLELSRDNQIFARVIYFMGVF